MDGLSDDVWRLPLQAVCKLLAGFCYVRLRATLEGRNSLAMRSCFVYDAKVASGVTRSAHGQ